MNLRPTILLVIAAGCAGGTDGTGRIVTRDTAVAYAGETVNVRIVENPAVPPGDRPVWRLADAPELDIGGDAESGGTALYNIAGAFRLSDGRVVIADGGSTTLRVFDASGAETGAIGGAGDGPGEFRSMTYVARLAADSILVADLGLARITVFGPDGAPAREARFGDRPESPRSSPIGVFADGTLLTRGFIGFGDTPPRGLLRPSTGYFHIDAAGALLDSLSSWPSGEMFFAPIERGFRVETARFPRTTSVVASGGRYLVARSERYEVRVFDERGTPLLRIRRAWEPRPIRQADLDAERQSRLDALSGAAPKAELERMLAEMPVPDAMPAFDRVAADEDGNLWVRDYRPPWEEGDATWSVFDADGRITARAVTPAGFEPRQIGRDFVLGVWKDALDVEHVQLYRLLKDG